MKLSGSDGSSSSDVCSIQQLIEIYYRIVLETRTDWLALQVIYIQFDTTRKDGPSLNGERVRLIKNLRDLMTKSTERLSDRAIELGYLQLNEMSTEFAKFYDALPQGMFRKVQPKKQAVSVLKPKTKKQNTP